MADRSVAIITPKPPFLEWAQQAYGEAAPPPGMSNQPRAFLIPRASDDQEGFDYVQVVCAAIFAAMLGGWQPDRSTWPADLDSCTRFTAWFDVQIVIDLAELDPEAA